MRPRIAVKRRLRLPSRRVVVVVVCLSLLLVVLLSLVRRAARGASREPQVPRRSALLVFMEPRDADVASLTERLTPFAPVDVPAHVAKPFASWQMPPDWLDMDHPLPTLNASEIKAWIPSFPSSGDVPWLINAPHNMKNAQAWLDALADVRPVTCVFARRASRAERIFQAFDAMGRNLASGAEVLAGMDVMRARAKAACLEAGARTLEFVRTSKRGWVTPDEAPGLDPEDTGLWQPLLDSVPPQLPTTFVREPKQAYVALLTAASKKYADGALVLGRSLALFDASRERVLLATDNVPDAVLAPLKKGGWTLRRVAAVKEHWFPTCPYVPAREDQKTRWGLMSSKLLIFGMAEFDAVLYLDSDTVVTGRLGDMFALSHSLQQYSVIAEGGIQHDFVNAGVMLVRPDKQLFADMMTFFASTKPKKLFGNLIDCTEMGLINAFFGLPHKLVPDEQTGALQVAQPIKSADARTAILPVRIDTKLAIGRPDLQRDYTRHCPWAIHFMRKDHCSKPWDVCPRGKMGKVGGKCDTFPYVVWCRLK